MLVEQNFPQLSFEMNNPGAPNTVYATTNDTVNKLTFRITTFDTNETIFTKGEPVPIENAPTATGSLLYLDLSELQLTAAEFALLDCTTENWDYKLYAPVICFAPKTDFTITPGQEIKININKLTISNPPSTPSVSLYVNFYRTPPVTSGKYPQVTSFGVSIQNAPGGKANLHEDLDCEFGANRFICNTIPKYKPVANKVSLVFKPGPLKKTVVAGPNTVFIVSFVYADNTSGYGALTTAAKANEQIKINRVSNTWKVTHDTNSQNPNWKLEPNAGLPIVGENSTVQFDIVNIITDFKPGPTVMTVQYKGIDGYNDGSFSLVMHKIQHVAISSLTVTPNPSYLDEDGEVSVYVHWNATDAGTLLLNMKDVTNETEKKENIKNTTTFTLLAHGNQLSDNGNIASQEVQAVVLPKINSFTSTPADIYYKGFPAEVRLAWNVIWPGYVRLKSSVTGTDPNLYNPVGEMPREIKQPQMLTLMPDKVTDPLYMRNIVLSAFKLVPVVREMWEAPTEELIALPSGNLILAICSTYPYLRLINTLTYKEVMKPITVANIPRSFALSKDAKLLYIASEGGSMLTTFSVTQTAPDQVSLNEVMRVPVDAAKLWGVAVSPAGDQVYAMIYNNPGMLKVYNQAADYKLHLLTTINLPPSPMAVAVSPSGKNIFVATAHGVTPIVRNANNTFQTLSTIGTGGRPQGLAVTPDGELVFVSNAESNTVSIISINTLQVIQTISVDHHPHYICITPSSDYIFISHLRSVITLIGYNNTTGTYQVLEKGIKLSDGHGVAGMTVMPGGKQIFVAGSANNYNINSLNLVSYESIEAIRDLNLKPTSAVASPDKKRVMVWANPKAGGVNPTSVNVIDTSNFRRTTIFDQSAVYDLVFSPNGKTMYIIQKNGDVFSVHAKDGTTYEDRGTVTGLTGTPDKLAVSADGDLLLISVYGASGANNGVAVVQTSGLAVKQTVTLPATDNNTYMPVAVTPDMQKVFVAQNNAMWVLEQVADGYKLRDQAITVGGSTHALGVLPDGAKVIAVSGSEERLICIVDTKNLSKQQIEIPKDYCNYIAGLGISPDGSEIAVCTLGGKMVLFIDMTTHNVISTIETHDNPQGAVYLPDASQIYIPCYNTASVTVLRQIQPGA